MDDVEGGPREGGRTDDFGDSLDARSWFETARAAHVHEDRYTALGRQTEHLDHFQPGGAWCGT